MAGDSRQRQRPGVDPLGVSVVAVDRRGTIGDQCVELLPSGESAGKGAVEPAEPEDPGGVGMGGGEVADAPLHLRQGLGLEQVDQVQ